MREPADRSSPSDSVLQRCGPYEPGTCTLVAESDGTCFSYCPPGQPRPRSPVPGETVRMRWTTGAAEHLTGTGLVVAVVDEKHVYGPVVLVLWSVAPRRFMPDWDPQF